MSVGERSIRRWLDDVWDRTHWLAIRRGGEDGSPVGQRHVEAVVTDPQVLDRIRAWTTNGGFSGDVCRCLGDLTLVLYDTVDEQIGSATVHPDSISWERRLFENDLKTPHVSSLRLFLAQLGVDGASTSVLNALISLMNLHEGPVQFRPSGDDAALVSHRVPPSLFDDLRHRSGEGAANVDDAEVRRLFDHLSASQGVEGVRQIFAWLGSATWPAEAISGDGQLARRLLDEFDQAEVRKVLPGLSEPSEVMGAVAWAAFRDSDAAVMSTLGPAVAGLLTKT